MLRVTNKERRQISERNAVSNKPVRQRPQVSSDLFRHNVDGCGEIKAGKQFEDRNVKPETRPQRCLQSISPHPVSETCGPVMNEIHDPAMLHTDTLCCPSGTGRVDDAGEILCSDFNFIEPGFIESWVVVAIQDHPPCLLTIQHDDWPAIAGSHERIFESSLRQQRHWRTIFN